MKISSHIHSFNYRNNLNINENNKNTTGSISQNKSPRFFAYQDYNVSFGERLHRTPEEFYAQPFNINNMPVTVKKFLHEDFEEHHHMPPAQLQREAYKYIKIADSVDDIKEMYPDEPLFEKLRPFSETRATRGTLFLLRWDAMTSNTPIFKDRNEKDLTVYFLKKVYLEGKTLKEINKDFENDSTYQIRKELGIKDGKYFTHSDLNSLGIRYPNIPYYNSFLATREDKEYIPIKRTSENTNSTNNGVQDRAVSDETKEKLSDAKRRWWHELSPADRDEQIQKMIEGKELSNSVYAKYQGPIMTIAAAKIGFSNRLVSVISEKYADADFNEENDTFSEKQREIMLEFWNKDNYFRRNYSNALKSTILEFENAHMSGDAYRIERLLKQAGVIKKSLVDRAKQRKIAKAELQKQVPVPPKKSEEKPVSRPEAQQVRPQPHQQQKSFDINSPKDVNKAFRTAESLSMNIYPDIFREEMLRFLMEKVSFEDKRLMVGMNTDNPMKTLGISEEMYDALSLKVSENVEKYNQLFNETHRLVANTNDFIFSKFLYELTGKPQSFRFERGDINDEIKRGGLGHIFIDNKQQLNKDMKRFCVPLSTKEATEFYENDFFKYVNSIESLKLDNSFVLSKNSSALDFLKMTFFISKTNEKFKNQIIEFFKSYNANIRYLKSHADDKDACDVVMQNMVIKYMLYVADLINNK